MRAMQFDRTAPIQERPLVPRELPDPEPGRGELLVRIHVCAICRTDLHVIEGDLPLHALPMIPGHQAVGVVERCGPGCLERRPGDRVGIAWLQSTCGGCEFCRTGRENLCASSRYTGYHAPGGYAERAVVPEGFAYPIPDVFDDLHAAPLLCAGIIGYRALQRSDTPRGGRLVLYGFGSSAHVVMQLALHRGIEVYVVTRGEGHRSLARRMGATWVGASGDVPPEKMHSGIIFAPAGELVPEALRALQRGGTLALAGIHMSTVPPMEYEPHLFHEKNLRSVEANTREDGLALLAEAAEVPVRPKITTFTLEEANEALIRLKEDAIDGTGVLVVSGE